MPSILWVWAMKKCHTMYHLILSCIYMQAVYIPPGSAVKVLGNMVWIRGHNQHSFSLVFPSVLIWCKIMERVRVHWLLIGMSVDMHHTYLKVACEQRVFHLAPPLELDSLHLGVLLLQLHVDHQHFPLSVLPVNRIRHSCNITY